MRMSKFILKVLIVILCAKDNAFAQHQMQHGFILSNNDQIGSHLVANGHHSRQTEIMGRLTIQNSDEREHYQQRKKNSAANRSYFLFQAQQLDLPRLQAGQTLTGHIVESRIGSYEPKNIIVKSATFHIQRVLLNIANPFFAEKAQSSSTRQSPSTHVAERNSCKYVYAKDSKCLVCNGVVKWCKYFD